MSCAAPPEVVIGARGLRITYRVQERNAAGVLVPVDLTAAATPPGFVRALFLRPGTEPADERLDMRDASIVGLPSEGLVEYVTEDGFLDRIGTWQTQLFVNLPGVGPGSGFFLSRIEEFHVLPALRPFGGEPLLTVDELLLELFASPVNVS